MFDGGAGYRVWNNLAIGVAVSMFTRSPAGTVSVTIPDPIAFNAFTTVAASPQLTQTEVGTHIKVVYFLRVNDKMDVAISAGPSFVHLSKDIASASVVNGAAQIAVATQTGSGAGVNGGADLQYFFTPRLGGGIFVRYVPAQVDLPAASGVTVGGFRAVSACGSALSITSSRSSRLRSLSHSVCRSNAFSRRLPTFASQIEQAYRFQYASMKHDDDSAVHGNGDFPVSRSAVTAHECGPRET